MSLPPGATLVSGEVPMALPPGATLVGSAAPSEAASKEQAAPDSFWRTVYDRSGLGALQKLTGQLSDWAKSKAEEKEKENLANVAAGKPAVPMEVYSPRAGYDLLSHAAGFISSALDPKSVAITGGVIAANTNPFTGIPTDIALAAHGGYGVATNAKEALKGNPAAVERALLSGSEAVGGAAGVAGQVGAVRPAIQNIRNVFGPAAAPTTAEASGATAGAAPATAAQPTGGAAAIARSLGIADPPPASLLTRAIKPLNSNTGWDAALAKAMPDMKAAESSLGHPISGIDDALNAASIAKKSLWSQYAAKISQVKALGPNAPSLTNIDGNAVADAMMNSIDKRTALQNPDLVERITKVADTYRRSMPLEEAEDFLQSVNNDLHGYYAKNKVGRQVAERDPATGHVVAEGDALRDQLYSKLNELTGPGAADLKQRYGALSNVENELLRRKNIAARAQPESLAEQLSMARAYGKIAVGVARLSPTSLLEGTQSLAAAKFLKERGTSDAMITRAFSRIGQPGAAPSGVQLRPTVAPAATGAVAGTANQPAESGAQP